MGADYYQCASYNRGFRDDSDHCAWCECNNCFCSAECAKLDNYGEWNDEAESNRIDLEKDITCVICRKEAYNDYTLLESVLKHFKISRKQAIEIWRTESDNGK